MTTRDIDGIYAGIPEPSFVKRHWYLPFSSAAYLFLFCIHAGVIIVRDFCQVFKMRWL